MEHRRGSSMRPKCSNVVAPADSLKLLLFGFYLGSYINYVITFRGQQERFCVYDKYTNLMKFRKMYNHYYYLVLKVQKFITYCTVDIIKFLRVQLILAFADIFMLNLHEIILQQFSNLEQFMCHYLCVMHFSCLCILEFQHSRSYQGKMLSFECRLCKLPSRW